MRPRFCISSWIVCSWRFDVLHWGQDTASVYRHNLVDEEFKEACPLAAMIFTSIFMIHLSEVNV